MRSFRDLLRVAGLSGLLSLSLLRLAADSAVRKDVRELSEAEVRQWTASVVGMKRIPSRFDPSVNAYDWFVRTHLRAFENASSGAHGGPAFLPWHREFLRAFESEMNRAGAVIGYTNRMATPYWDCFSAESTSAAFSERLLGGNGAGPGAAYPIGPVATRPTPYRVRTGAFATRDDRTSDWLIDTNYTSLANTGPGQPYLQRSLDTFPGVFSGNPLAVPEPYPTPDQSAELPTADQFTHLLSVTNYDEPHWDYTVESGVDFFARESFRNLVEGNTGLIIAGQVFGSLVHGRAHLWVGGPMVTGASPNDPAFFLHHANIDRVWAEWQDRHGVFNFPAEWLRAEGSNSVVAVAATEAMWPFQASLGYPRDLSPLDLLDLRATGVRYATQAESGPAGAAVRLLPRSDGGYEVESPALRGLSYQLQSAASPAGPWQGAGTAIQASSATVVLGPVPTEGAEVRFLRVVSWAEGNQPAVVPSETAKAVVRVRKDAVCGAPSPAYSP